MKKFDLISKEFPHFLHGGDYNPEQWKDTPEIWDEDMKLMKEANCNEMTVGIFSWAELEPEEGKYNFEWLDTIINKVYENGGRIVLATPSGAKPKWMTDKYPEILRVTETDVRNYFGSRHNHCPNSPVYRQKVKNMNEMLSERYGKHPAVVAWHLSNEYSAADCYCENCQKAFREWVKKKYDNDIDKLNRAWWTRFWSHSYTSFDQIEAPRANGEARTLGLNLDWRRFMSDSVVEFASLEAKAVRKYSDRPVTTNCMGYVGIFDHFKMAEVLDVASNDFYPRWSRSTEYVGEETAHICALYRGLKNGRPFMVMESAPGINNCGMQFLKVKNDEEQFLEAMLFAAYGADTVQYFQWRKGRGAFEKFHGAVVDHYGKTDNRVFQNVKRTGESLKKIEGVLGCGIKSEIALVHDYDSMWALDGGYKALWTNDVGMGYIDTRRHFFSSIYEKNIPVDVIGKEADFSKYKVICLYVPYIVSEEFGAKLKKFVEDGGILISTYLTAVANETDLCYLGGVPGAGLTEVFGLRVDEVDNFANTNRYYSDHNTIEATNSVIYNGKEYSVNSMAELIVQNDAEVLATFTNDIEKGRPAVLKNNYGKGCACYIGFAPDKEFMDAFVKDIADEYNIKAPEEVVSDNKYVRVSVREGDGEKYIFVMNLTRQEQTAEIKGEFTDLLTGKKVSGKQNLAPLGVMVLR